MKLHKQAFTLIELLLVIVILAILAGIVIVAINPARQVAQANNSQRESDVRALLDAVQEYAVDQRGVFPAEITSTATVVGSGTGQVDICTYLVPDYLTAMPVDPTDADAAYTDCTSYDTEYTIAIDADNRVTVAAPGAELSETIAITR